MHLSTPAAGVKRRALPGAADPRLSSAEARVACVGLAVFAASAIAVLLNRSPEWEVGLMGAMHAAAISEPPLIGLRGLDLVMSAATIAGSASTIALLDLAVCLWLIRGRRALVLTALPFAGYLLLTALKGAFDRGGPPADLARPMVLESPLLTLEHLFRGQVLGPAVQRVAALGFPSGHAFLAVAGFGWLATLVEGRFLRHGSVLAFSLVLAAVVSVSRVYLGAHWPTDVLAGAGLGLVMLAAMRTMRPG
jgi:membrane-associated phospholipid phosphatase